MDADVAVVGLGSMGSMALWQLASRGTRVMGLEQFEIGHSLGAGHGDSKIFRTVYAEGAEYVPLLRASLPLWRQLEEETESPILTLTGGLMIGVPGEDFLSGVLTSARVHGLDHEMLTPAEAMRRFPQFRLASDEYVIWDPRAGVLRPERAIAAAVGRAQRLGARVLTGIRVCSLVPQEGGVKIDCGDRTFRVGRVVLAAGAWIPKLLCPPFPSPFWVERQVQAWFPVEKTDWYLPERFGIFARVREGHNWYGFPTLDRHTIKVAFHHGGERTDPDRLDREVHASDLDPLCEAVASELRGVKVQPVRATVCMYINTPDQHFVIGPLPEAPQIIMAGPMAGHGFKFAPIVGSIVADLALSGVTHHPIAPFDPARPAMMGATTSGIFGRRQGDGNHDDCDHR